MPLPGEIVAAKYRGHCVLCGGAFAVGAQIHYLKASGAEHIACAEKAAAAVAPHAGHLVVFYREEPPQLGQVLRLASCDGPRVGRVVVPLVHRRRYYKEDGLSFGLSKDNGWLFTVEARPATAAEEASLGAEEADAAAARAERQRRVEAWRRVTRAIDALRDQPPSADPQGREWPEEPRRLDAPYLVIDEPGGLVWHVVYNGRDGDLWSSNNYSSSIATRAPLTPELRADLALLGALARG